MDEPDSESESISSYEPTNTNIMKAELLEKQRLEKERLEAELLEKPQVELIKTQDMDKEKAKIAIAAAVKKWLETKKMNITQLPIPPSQTALPIHPQLLLPPEPPIIEKKEDILNIATQLLSEGENNKSLITDGDIKNLNIATQLLSEGENNKSLITDGDTKNLNVATELLSEEENKNDIYILSTAVNIINDKEIEDFISEDGEDSVDESVDSVDENNLLVSKLETDVSRLVAILNKYSSENNMDELYNDLTELLKNKNIPIEELNFKSREQIFALLLSYVNTLTEEYNIENLKDLLYNVLHSSRNAPETINKEIQETDLLNVAINLLNASNKIPETITPQTVQKEIQETDILNVAVNILNASNKRPETITSQTVQTEIQDTDILNVAVNLLDASPDKVKHEIIDNTTLVKLNKESYTNRIVKFILHILKTIMSVRRPLHMSNFNSALKEIKKVITNKDINIIKESNEIKSYERPLDVDKLLKYIQILRLLVLVIDKYIKLMEIHWTPLYKKGDMIRYKNENYVISEIDMEHKKYDLTYLYPKIGNSGDSENRFCCSTNGVTIDLNSQLEKEIKNTKQELFTIAKKYINDLTDEINIIIDKQKSVKLIEDIVDLLLVSQLSEETSDLQYKVQKGGEEIDIMVNKDPTIEYRNEEILDDIINVLMVNALSKSKSQLIEEILYDDIIYQVNIIFENIKDRDYLKKIINDYFSERYTKYNFNEDEVIRILKKILSLFEMNERIRERKETCKADIDSVNNAYEEGLRDGKLEEGLRDGKLEEGLRDGKLESKHDIYKEYKLKDNLPIDDTVEDAGLCGDIVLNADEKIIGKMDDSCLIYDTITGDTRQVIK